MSNLLGYTSISSTYVTKNLSTGSNPYTGASFTPVVGCLYLVSVIDLTGNPYSNTFTTSYSGLSFSTAAQSAILYDASGVVGRQLTVYWAYCTSTSGAVNLTWTASTPSNSTLNQMIMIEQFAGIDTSQANTVVQASTTKSSGIGTNTVTGSLAAFATSSNSTYVCGMTDATSTPTWTDKTGYASGTVFSQTSFGGNLNSEYFQGNDQAPTLKCAASFAYSVIISLEIATLPLPAHGDLGGTLTTGSFPAQSFGGFTSFQNTTSISYFLNSGGYYLMSLIYGSSPPGTVSTTLGVTFNYVGTISPSSNLNVDLYWVYAPVTTSGNISWSNSVSCNVVIDVFVGLANQAPVQAVTSAVVTLSGSQTISASLQPFATSSNSVYVICAEANSSGSITQKNGFSNVFTGMTKFLSAGKLSEDDAPNMSVTSNTGAQILALELQGAPVYSYGSVLPTGTTTGQGYLSVQQIASGGFSSTATSFTTPSFSVIGGNVYAISVLGSAASGASVSATFSDGTVATTNGSTTSVSFGYASSGTLFAAPSSSGTVTCTFTFTASQVGSVYVINCLNLANTVPAVQSSVGLYSDVVSGINSDYRTLSAFANVANGVYSILAIDSSASSMLMYQAAGCIFCGSATNSNGRGLFTFYKPSNDTAPKINWYSPSSGPSYQATHYEISISTTPQTINTYSGMHTQTSLGAGI